MFTSRALVADQHWSTLIAGSNEGAGWRQGQVVSSFDHACSFAFSQDRPRQLWTVVTRGKGPAPNTLTCDGEFLPRLSQEACFTVRGGYLVAPGVEIELAGCRMVDCRIEEFSDSQLRPLDLEGLVAQWQEISPPGSFKKNSNPPPVEQHIHQLLWRGVNAFVQSLGNGSKGRDSAALQRAAHSLVGLGVGLTPAGDDFLVGLLAWCAACLPLRPVFDDIARGVATALEQTTEVSEQFLTAALERRFSAQVSAAVAAVIKGDDHAGLGSNQGIPLAFKQLVELGSTSGSDTLLGIIMGTVALGQSPTDFDFEEKLR